jgi:hypothetical protein
LTLDSEQLLRERFSRLANPVDDSDWTEVTRRASAGLRPRLLLLAAAAVVVAAIAAPALGLTGKVVQLFDGSEPARARFEKDAPLLAPDVITGDIQKVLDEPAGEGARTLLWVAPTRSGGFCMAVELAKVGQLRPGGGTISCDRNRQRAFNQGGFGDPRGPILYYGSILIDGARLVRVDFEDGERAKVPLVWVSEPIDAGFYVYVVPRRHWAEGHRPKAATVVDENGKALARQSLRWFMPPSSSDR